LTGWGGAAHRARAQAAGIDLHLTKPVLPEDLARALGRLRTST
jgi:CheY-like chemotaxis protein